MKLKQNWGNKVRGTLLYLSDPESARSKLYFEFMSNSSDVFYIKQSPAIMVISHLVLPIIFSISILDKTSAWEMVMIYLSTGGPMKETHC